MHAEGLGGLADKLHHGHRSDGQHLVVLHTRFQQSLELDGAEALLTVGAVVGHQVQVIRAGTELVFQDDNVLVPEADDHVHNGAGLLEGTGSGQSDGAAHAAADNAHPLLALHVGGLAQGADEVPDVVALVQFSQSLGGEAHLLEDDADSTLLAVVAGDGQRHTLAHLIDPEDDELTCLCLSGNEGGLDVHQGDVGIELLLTHDFIHF